MIAPDESAIPRSAAAPGAGAPIGPLPAAPELAEPEALSGELRIRLGEVFSGPMDLLLHLVRENEVEISEVSLARVCGEFLRYVRDLASIDLALAGDYLVVAATLVAIKSRALVPRGDEVELEDDVDAGDDLVRRLLQYRRVREAARDLSVRARERERLFARGVHDMPDAEEGEIDLGDATAYDLFAAFARILRETGGAGGRLHRIHTPDRSVGEFMRDVAEVLRRQPRAPFEALFGESRDRRSVIGVFLAILELAKQGAIRASQRDAFGAIEVERAIDDGEAFDALVARAAGEGESNETSEALPEGEEEPRDEPGSSVAEVSLDEALPPAGAAT